MRRDLADQRDVFFFYLAVISYANSMSKAEERRRRRRLMPSKFLSQRELCPVLSSRPSPMSVYWLATWVFYFSQAIALGQLSMETLLLPWLHAIFDFITQVDWRECTNYNTWSRCRAEEGDGEGRKKYFSLPNTSPAPYESPHCLDYFRIQHCGYTNKNNHTRRENVRNAGYMKAYGDNF